MELFLQLGEFERLICTLQEGEARATVTAANAWEAIVAFERALTSLDDAGIGECYWLEAAGDYRWLFRRNGETLQVAVLWSTGTMTGWEHVFWTEGDCEELRRRIRSALALLPTPDHV